MLEATKGTIKNGHKQHLLQDVDKQSKKHNTKISNTVPTKKPMVNPAGQHSPHQQTNGEPSCSGRGEPSCS